jgi:hypothetical protein
VDWIQLAEVSVQSRVIVNFRVPLKTMNLLISGVAVGFSGGTQVRTVYYLVILLFIYLLICGLSDGVF